MDLDTTLPEAELHAAHVATTIGLPQTVFRNADSGGWWHTNPMASLLANAELSVTVLPATYFR